MDAYGIFEGGGAKGLAHVGALSSAESRGIKFRGVAGASAGAIVASLISAGYRSEDLFDKSNASDPSKIYSEDFTKFFGKDWHAFVDFTQDIRSLINHPIPLWAWLEIIPFNIRNWSINRRLKRNLGVFSTNLFQLRLDEILRAKLDREGNDPITFADLPSRCPLKIIATNLDSQQIIIFSKENCPDLSVAQAVAASICLPFVFEPVRIDSNKFLHHQSAGVASSSTLICAIDGGLLSNFPAWLFDRERSRSKEIIPTMGFRLVEHSGAGPNWHHDCRPRLGPYAWRIIGTVVNGDPLLETRQVDEMHEIPLVVTANTLQFEMSAERKSGLFNEGYAAAERFFKNPSAPRDPDIVNKALSLTLQAMRSECGLAEHIELRANICRPTNRGTLRITYAVGMEDDTDDALEFPIRNASSAANEFSSGACGICWERGVPIYCDLAEVKSNFDEKWHMDKYQQALVRSDLKSLLCVPILMPDLGTEQSPAPGSPIGVLNFDSPQDLLSLFQDFNVIGVAELLASELLGSALTGG